MAEPNAPGWMRWAQLALGVVCMSLIANMQYGWTLFVQPIDDAHHWGKPAIQWAFTLFVLAETWLLPVEGWLVDLIGPRVVVIGGGALVALSWLLNAQAESLPVLYAAALIGGAGAGAVYGACVGGAVKWFPDRRGLAAGLTAAGFGMGSALTVAPIAAMIKSAGYPSTFVTFALIQGVGVIAAGLFLRRPPAVSPVVAAAAPGIAPGAVLRVPIFWLMYLAFVMVAAGGVMATAQLSIIAKDYGVADASVTLFGFTQTALVMALSLDRMMNGITRPFFGWLSDQIGRETTMLLAFTLEGAGILALLYLAHGPMAFVLISGLVFFAWGEIYSIFPALCTDVFGRRFATANYGLLYTAKGTAALLVPFASSLREASGNWSSVMLAAAVMNFAAALIAYFPISLMRQRQQAAVPTAAPAPSH